MSESIYVSPVSVRVHSDELTAFKFYGKISQNRYRFGHLIYFTSNIEILFRLILAGTHRFSRAVDFQGWLPSYFFVHLKSRRLESWNSTKTTGWLTWSGTIFLKFRARGTVLISISLELIQHAIRANFHWPIFNNSSIFRTRIYP